MASMSRRSDVIRSCESPSAIPSRPATLKPRRRVSPRSRRARPRRRSAAAPRARPGRRVAARPQQPLGDRAVPASRRSSRAVYSARRPPRPVAVRSASSRGDAVLPADIRDPLRRGPGAPGKPGQVDREVGSSTRGRAPASARRRPVRSPITLARPRSPRGRDPRSPQPPPRRRGRRSRASARRARAPPRRPRRASRRRGRRRGARVGKPPRAPAVIAGEQRRRRAGLDPGGAERQPDADRGADLVLLEPGHDRLPSERSAICHSPCPPSRTTATSTVVSWRSRALARHARRQPGRDGVRVAAHVAADDADAGAHRRHDPLADARHGAATAAAPASSAPTTSRIATYSVDAWPCRWHTGS